MNSDPQISTSTKSTVKTPRVLQLFSMGKNQRGIREIMRELGYHKSSVHRIVTTLEANRFLSRVAEGKGLYRLGPVLPFSSFLKE